MESSKQIAARSKEVFLNGLWIANTNYNNFLSNVSWTQANMKVGSLNSIGLLTNHVHYYVAGMLQVFEGGSLEIRDKFSFDFTPIESESDWGDLLEQFRLDATKFVDWIDSQPDSKMDEIFVDEKYGSYRRNIEGMIEHAYYHLGQMVLLKKILDSAI